MKPTSPITLATLAPLILTLVLNGCIADASTAADDEKARAAEVTKHLQNPVANLISVPIENDWDFGSGPADAMTYTASLKPVVPISLDEDWSLITRTIVPLIYSESPMPGGKSSTGLGDITTSVYLSPNEAMWGWDWGVGPGLILPGATDHSLGSGKWSAGPTAAVLRQDGPWTLGMLTGHAWSFAGDAHRSSVSTTYLQPFASYTIREQTTFGVDTTSEYDWVAGQWTVPLELSVSQVVGIGKRAVQFGLTGRWYAERPSDGPDWGLGFTVTFTFPK